MASIEWLYFLLSQTKMEWLLTSPLYYNISIILSVLSCEEVLPPENLGHQPVSDEHKEEPSSSHGFLNSILNFFKNTPQDETLVSSSGSSDGCSSVIHFEGTQSLSAFYTLLLTGLSLSTLIFLLLFALCSSKRDNKQDARVPKQEIQSPEKEISKEYDKSTDTGDDIVSLNNKSSKQLKVEKPLMINVPKFDNNKENLIQHIQHIDYVLECTIGFFLKEVDVHLGTAMSHSVNSPEGRTRLPSSPSSNSISSLTSPRLPRRVINPPRQSPQSLPSQMPVTKNDDSYAKSWIQFEKFKACLGWVFPEVNFDGANIGQVSQGDQKLSLILQFLYQNCPIRPLQWNVATSVVSYSLYILDHQLKAINADLSDLLTFCRFESIGSATEGTLVGAANRFDALFLIDISKLTEMTILHNNFCSDIPAGHVILGVKDGSSPACQNFKYIKKACVQNLFGFYLVPQEVEEYVEALLKKAILKLYRESKSKMDRLPFSFQLSPTKKLNLTIDTRLMQGLGLGLSEINIRFIPALSLSVVDFSMLPPIYAVPTWGSGTNHEAKGNTLPKTVLSRIFRDQSNNDLLWNICTDKLNSTVIKNFEKRLNLSGVRGHHKECLMILKALFSQSTKNTLLNKGEIDATVLSTVISFLLQESSASAWTLESLADRVSDSIHFLKSCFENILLPNFSVHNPHLLEQIPCLEMLTPLLSGRQQNILSHVSNDAALKVLGYIEQRLQETGLRKCVKQEFSANMWEYEFFIFG